MSAARAQVDSSKPIFITLTTFGSPRVGDYWFARRINRSKRVRHYRVQNELDLVARVPRTFPHPWAYAHTGHHVCLDNNGGGKIRWIRGRNDQWQGRRVNPCLLLCCRCIVQNRVDVGCHLVYGADDGRLGYWRHLTTWEWKIPAPRKAPAEPAAAAAPAVAVQQVDVKIGR